MCDDSQGENIASMINKDCFNWYIEYFWGDISRGSTFLVDGAFLPCPAREPKIT